MRPSSKSRNRNRNNRRTSSGNIINRVFESAGPDGKVRGTPQQVIEKYSVLAHDAQLSGDRVAAENFMQHSEHYNRILSEAQRENELKQDSENPSSNGALSSEKAKVDSGGKITRDSDDTLNENDTGNRSSTEASENVEKNDLDNSSSGSESKIVK